MRRSNISYYQNVVASSYTHAFWKFEDWQHFIDWMALSGINIALAYTGQELLYQKTFAKFGVNTSQFGNWSNGVAWLGWSRGQSMHGVGTSAEKPLSQTWMHKQWALQKQILARYRSLGIVGQLPGFQGNVPVGLKAVLKDSNMTDNKKGTAWMDSLDPAFGQVADEWMRVLTADFGTDHWYQLDGYFDGKTAPWYERGARGGGQRPPAARWPWAWTA